METMSERDTKREREGIRKRVPNERQRQRVGEAMSKRDNAYETGRGVRGRENSC